jgi:hypothetical protein
VVADVDQSICIFYAWARGQRISDALLIKTTWIETVTLTNKPFYVVAQREGKVVPRKKPHTFYIYKRHLVVKWPRRVFLSRSFSKISANMHPTDSSNNT